MTLSTHSTRRLRTGLRKSLTITFAACAIAFPAQAIAGGPVSEKTAGLWPPAETSAPIVSEKLAGLQAAPRSAPIVSEKLAGLQQAAPRPALLVSEKLAGLQQAAPRPALLVSEKLAGLLPELPASEPVVSTSGRGFDWSDAGIGAAITFASMLSAAAATLTIRRRRSSFAH
jgi:hypothetical protein